MAVSYAMFTFASDKSIMNDIRFNPEFFFLFILPTIMFPSGYNMRRKKFFKNIATVFKFGFVATLVCYTIYVTLMFSLWHFDLVSKWDPVTERYVKLNLDMY